jgi:hypothetical protein
MMHDLGRDPMDGGAWMALAHALSGYRGDAYRWLTHWLPLADRCAEAAVQVAGGSPDILFRAGDYWLWRTTVGGPAGVEGGDQPFARAGHERFQTLYARALEQDPRRWQSAAARVWSVHPDDEVVLGIAPDSRPELQRLILQFVVSRTAPMP